MNSARDAQSRATLQSWKEIASYLGVTVRSVQRWEKESGLPVYRQGGGKSARVFAHTDELRGWMEATDGAKRVAGERGLGSGSRIRFAAIAAVIVFLALAAVPIWRAGLLGVSRVADGWELEGSTLRVFDASHRLCWEKRLPPFHPDFGPEAADKVTIADIDRDGRKEILLNYFPLNLDQAGGSLLCFNESGSPRWEFHYGSPKTFGRRSFTSSYRGRLLRPVQIAGKPYLLTVANHVLWYPTQVALLDPGSGRLVEEYWHPGAIYQAIVQDLDGDGQDEVILGGVNNPGEGLGHAALAALTLPFSKARRTVSPPDDPFPPLTGGGELAYALFPHSDVCQISGFRPTFVRLSIDQSRRIIAETMLPGAGGIIYYLGFDFQVQEYRFSDEFAPLHQRLYLQHLLDHPLSARESESLGKVLRLTAAPDGNSPRLKQFWGF